MDVKFQPVGLAGGQQVQRRRENDFVLRKVLRWPRKIHGDVAVVQRVVDELNVLAQVEKFVRLDRLLQRPVVVVRVKNAGLGHDPGVFDGGGEQFQFLADLADFLEDAVVAFEVVRQDRAGKFFVADARLPPAKIKHAAGAARNQLVGEQPDDAGTHERIDVLPVDLAGLLFHDPETAIAVGRFDVRFFQRAEDVNVAGEFGGFGLDGRVAFNGDKVHDVGHVEVVEFAVERAQVDGDGMVGANFMQDIGLHPDKGDDGVAAKTVPIQQQRRVVRGGRMHGHRHFVQGGNDLSPVTQAQQSLRRSTVSYFTLSQFCHSRRESSLNDHSV